MPSVSCVFVCEKNLSIRYLRLIWYEQMLHAGGPSG